MKNALDGKRIAELRRNLGWEQQHLAEAAGVTASVISHLERNIQPDFKLSVVIAVAKALNVTILSKNSRFLSETIIYQTHNIRRL